MKKIFIFFTCIIIAFTSCTQHSSEYKKTQQENDSLKLLLKKNEAELNDMLSILNEIESDIQSIREAEDYLTLGSDAELTASKREQIRKNMLLISETLKRNKQKLAELQEKIDKSNVYSAALQKTVDRLSIDLNEKSELIVKLQKDLTQKNEQINLLSGKVEDLSEDIKILEDANISQSDKISEQDRTLNRIYYCFGTKKELKEQNILTGGGLFSKAKALEGDFNRDYFISKDKRQVHEIQLFSSKAKLRTNHPEGSYRFVKDKEGNITIEILNVNIFWSLSKYLVVEVG